MVSYEENVQDIIIMYVGLKAGILLVYDVKSTCIVSHMHEKFQDSSQIRVQKKHTEKAASSPRDSGSS